MPLVQPFQCEPFFSQLFKGPFAVFGGGGGGNGPLSTTSVYTYATNTAVAGSNLTYSAEFLAATGNSTIGVFGGSNAQSATSTTSVYTYSTNTAVAGGNLTSNTSGSTIAATGNGTIGVFGGTPYGNSDPSAELSVYNYSTNTSTAGSTWNSNIGGFTATGNSTVGLFAGGYEMNNTGTFNNDISLYTYSTNIMLVNNGVLNNNFNSGAASSNSTVAVFGWGQSVLTSNLSITSVYTYANNSSVYGGNLAYAASGIAATGNGTIGIYGGGDVSTTSIYTYSSNTSVAGGNLTYSAGSLAACAPNPSVNY